MRWLDRLNRIFGGWEGKVDMVNGKKVLLIRQSLWNRIRGREILVAKEDVQDIIKEKDNKTLNYFG